MNERTQDLEDGALRALMVDDDAVQLQVTGNLLTRAGFDVIFATSGGKALELFSRDDFHVAVVDLHLEDVKGVDLIRYLRAAPNGPEVRIVAWTASTDPALLSAAIEAGADDVYQKTMPGDVIEAKFRRLASKSKADVRRDTRLLGLELSVNSLLGTQSELLESVKAIRADIAPMRQVVDAWKEAQHTRRTFGRVFSWLKRFWLWLAAFAGAIAAVMALFPRSAK